MSEFMKSREYVPLSEKEFWCNCCDGNVVNSEKPESGKFYRMFGHTWDNKIRLLEVV